MSTSGISQEEMGAFPLTLTIGAAQVVEIQPDEMILRFSSGIDIQNRQATIASLGFAEVHVAEGNEKLELPEQLKDRGFHWVRRTMGAAPSKPLSEQTKEIVDGNNSIDFAAPAYLRAGLPLRRTAAPLYDSLAVSIDIEDFNNVAGWMQDQGFAHDEATSTLTAPVHYFSHSSAASEPDHIFGVYDALRARRDVRFVELNWLPLFPYSSVTIQPVPGDGTWNPGQSSQQSLVDINLPVTTWDKKSNGKGARVAILDDGFQLNHPALNPAFNNDWDFDGGTAGPDAASSHGTLMAGIIGARRNLGSVIGVAPDCTLIPMKIGWPETKRVTAGLAKALELSADVVNLSFWTLGSSDVDGWLSRMAESNVVVCAAAGGDGGGVPGYVDYPASSVKTVAVGATGKNKKRHEDLGPECEDWESQYGPELDVVAPGIRIWTTDELGTAGLNEDGSQKKWNGVLYSASGDDQGDYFALATGTSAATAHVSGLAALLVSKYRTSLTRDPDSDEIRAAIELACQKTGGYAYAFKNDRPHGKWNEEVGYGLIDCDKALDYLYE